MPYFHVDISHTQRKQFVVNAPDRDTAENIAFAAEASGECDNKKVIKLIDDNSSAISVSETDKASWLDSLKKAKAK